LFLPIDIFSLKEIIKIIFSKYNFFKNSKTIIDVYELDSNQKIISRDGIAVKLTEKELSLILALKKSLLKMSQNSEKKVSKSLSNAFQILNPKKCLEANKVEERNHVQNQKSQCH
jgi:hypothetical protein